MESVKKEIRNDLFLLQVPVQILLYCVFDNYFVNVSFFLGCSVSLANFNLMALQTQSLVGVEEKNVQRKAVSGFGFRYLLMAGTLALALSVPQIEPFSLLSGILGVQYVLFGREFFRRFFGWVLA
tara:strand:- start:295 stop:669 length:375 start_codon:yes stop_codon:yes gene_type:complete